MGGGGGGGLLDVRIGIDSAGNFGAIARNEAGRVLAQSGPALLAAGDRRTGANLQNYSARYR